MNTAFINFDEQGIRLSVGFEVANDAVVAVFWACDGTGKSYDWVTPAYLNANARLECGLSTAYDAVELAF